MSNRKKILFLPEWYPNHLDPQLGVFVEKYARAVSKFHDVAVIYVYPSDVTDAKMEITNDGFLVIKITYPKKKLTPLATLTYLAHHKKAREMLYREWGKPNLVHLHMLFRNYIAWNELYRWDCPDFILTEQWSGYLNGNYEKLPILKKRYYKKAFSQARAVTAVSNRLRDALEALFGRTDIKVVANIAERSQNTNNKTEPGTLKILVVADLVDEIKNISGIISAYSMAGLKKESELIIIGEGADKAKLMELAAKNKMAGKKITFKGRLNNAAVLDEMKSADFLVINSRFETFSMVAAEALLSGIPVVSSKCGGPEEFLDSSNSILVDVGNNQQLSEAICLMEDKLHEFSAEKIAEPVLRSFGMEAIGKKMSAIYDEIK